MLTLIPMTSIPSLITLQADLTAYCQKICGQHFIMLDTEFLRETTYYPKLCLIQAKLLGDDPVAIDALADGLDLAPFWQTIRDPDLLKVFHAGRQDLEIIVKADGRVPLPLFDTQIAASVLGFGEQVGFENLVRSVLHHQLDKGSQFTDWSRRPLTDRQLKYALDDVRYLEPVYLELTKQMKAQGREDWASSDLATLCDIATYQVDPNEIWRRVKIKSDKPRDLAVLRAVAAWRELEAQRRDMPRGRIIKDEPLGEIALHHPRTIDELCAIRGLDKGMARGKLGPSLLDAITAGLAVPDDDCPKLPRKKPLNDEQEALLDILKFVVKMRAREMGIAPRLLASSDDMEQLVRNDFATTRLAKGWRYDALGRSLTENPYFGFHIDLATKRVTFSSDKPQ